jgi:hypothetical protein
LIDLVKKKSDRSDVLTALVQIDPEGAECVPALITALDHDDYGVVDTAANCLGLLGRRASDAVPALSKALTRNFDEEFSNGVDPQVSAAKALRRIGPEATSAIPALIGALKYRRVVRSNIDGIPDDYADYSAATAAAEILGSFGSGTKAAVPALIEAIQTREKDDDNWMVRREAILALGRIGPNAKMAIPVLRNLINRNQNTLKYVPETMAALCQLAPDGKDIAVKWLNASSGNRFGWPRYLSFQQTPNGLEGPALILGAMGRTSVEGDCLTRRTLERLDRIFAQTDLRNGELPMFVGEWFEYLGRFGAGGRLAIPRLDEYRKHPNPWVRMWAGEALTQILPKDTPLRTPPRPTKSVPATQQSQGLPLNARGARPDRDTLS